VDRKLLTAAAANPSIHPPIHPFNLLTKDTYNKSMSVHQDYQQIASYSSCRSSTVSFQHNDILLVELLNERRTACDDSILSAVVSSVNAMYLESVCCL